MLLPPKPVRHLPHPHIHPPTHPHAACPLLRAAGDWRRCYGYVTALSCWGLMPQREAVLAMLRSRVQVRSARSGQAAGPTCARALTQAHSRGVRGAQQAAAHLPAGLLALLLLPLVLNPSFI